MAWVVDTSVLIASVVNEPEKSSIIDMTRGEILTAPASVYWEVGNALAAGMKRNRFSLPQAEKALDSFFRIPVRFVEAPLGDAIALADGLSIYAYDAYVLAVARALGQPILTLDGGLRHAAKKIGVEAPGITA